MENIVKINLDNNNNDQTDENKNENQNDKKPKSFDRNTLILKSNEADENSGHIRIGHDDSRSSSPLLMSSLSMPSLLNNSKYISLYGMSDIFNHPFRDNYTKNTNINEEEESLPSDIQTNDLEQFEQDKKAVYSHPLFPLLALLFEKCEMATRSINSFETDSSLSSFHNEIEEFIEHLKTLGKPFFTNNIEVDSLMIRAIQVFKIHLLELEKVSELCNDFCHRYISCLRSKMRSDVLIKGSIEISEEEKNEILQANGFQTDKFFSSSDDQREFLSPALSFSSMCSVSTTSSQSSKNFIPMTQSTPPASPSSSISTSSNQSNNFNNNNSDTILNLQKFETEPDFTATNATTFANLPNKSSLPLTFSLNFDTVLESYPSFFSKCINYSKIVNSNENHFDQKMLPNKVEEYSTDDDDDDDEEMIQDLSTKNRKDNINLAENDGNKSLSISLTLNDNDSQNEEQTVTKIETKILPIENKCPKICAKTNKIKQKTDKNLESNGSNQSKRGVLPKQATTIMRSWLFQHIVHPYPTEDEKRTIASQTKLTLLQVNNWFINARRRILPHYSNDRCTSISSADILTSEYINSSRTNTNQLTRRRTNNSSLSTKTNSINLIKECDLSNKDAIKTKTFKTKKVKSQKSQNLYHQQQPIKRFWHQSLANIIQTNDLNSKL